MATVLTLHARYKRGTQDDIEVYEIAGYTFLPPSEDLHTIARAQLKHLDKTIAGWKLTKLYGHLNSRKFS